VAAIAVEVVDDDDDESSLPSEPPPPELLLYPFTDVEEEDPDEEIVDAARGPIRRRLLRADDLLEVLPPVVRGLRSVRVS
jgi:hypothetical protein